MPLVETCQNGEAPFSLHLTESPAACVAALLESDQAAEVLAAIFLAGVRAGERSLATGRRIAIEPSPKL